MNEAQLRKLQGQLDEKIQAKRREDLRGPCPSCGQTPRLQMVPAPNELCGECMRRLRIMYPEAKVTAIVITAHGAKHYE